MNEATPELCACGYDHGVLKGMAVYLCQQVYQ